MEQTKMNIEHTEAEKSMLRKIAQPLPPPPPQSTVGSSATGLIKDTQGLGLGLHTLTLRNLILDVTE